MSLQDFLFLRLPADSALANDLTQLKHWRSFAWRQIFAENSDTCWPVHSHRSGYHRDTWIKGPKGAPQLRHRWLWVNFGCARKLDSWVGGLLRKFDLTQQRQPIQKCICDIKCLLSLIWRYPCCRFWMRKSKYYASSVYTWCLFRLWCLRTACCPVLGCSLARGLQERCRTWLISVPLICAPSPGISSLERNRPASHSQPHSALPLLTHLIPLFISFLSASYHQWFLEM